MKLPKCLENAKLEFVGPNPNSTEIFLPETAGEAEAFLCQLMVPMILTIPSVEFPDRESLMVGERTVREFFKAVMSAD